MGKKVGQVVLITLNILREQLEFLSGSFHVNNFVIVIIDYSGISYNCHSNVNIKLPPYGQLFVYNILYNMTQVFSKYRQFSRDL